MFALSNGLAKFQCSISTETVEVYTYVYQKYILQTLTICFIYDPLLAHRDLKSLKGRNF